MLFLGAMVASLHLLGCRATTDRSGVLPEAVAEHLDPSARWTVVYWPTPDECAACTAGIDRALDEAAARHPDLHVMTVLPSPAPAHAERANAGHHPGKVVTLDEPTWQRARTIVPLPRVEVWTGSGQLVLLRSLPTVAAQGDLLLQELEWSRAFTRPTESEGGT